MRGLRVACELLIFGVLSVAAFLFSVIGGAFLALAGLLVTVITLVIATLVFLFLALKAAFTPSP